MANDDQELLDALREAKMARLKSGVQGYKVGSRSVTYIGLKELADEIDRVDTAYRPKFRRVVVRDN